jgi:hypothetical protein
VASFFQISKYFIELKRKCCAAQQTFLLCTQTPPYTCAMSDPADIEKLAEQFIALWQQQLAAVAADDTLAETTMRMAHMFTAGTAAMGGKVSNPQKSAQNSGNSNSDDHEPDSAGSGTRAARPEAGGNAPVVDGSELDELRRRVDELEKRLAELEGGA